MFRDDRQTAAAVQVLLRSVRLEHLWTPAGPTEDAVKLLAERGGPMSHGEALMLLAAFDFWNGEGRAELSELLSVLDAERVVLVASLMIAAAEGPGSVDSWLARNGAASRLRSV
jgi:hypothetical protein